MYNLCVILFCLCLYFRIGNGNKYEYNTKLIHEFYTKWDSHSETNQLLTLICDNNFIFYTHQNKNTLQQYYEAYIKTYTNEQHSIYCIKNISSKHNINEYLIYIEYTALQWNHHRSHTLCNHYNYTVKMNITNHCIQSIQTPFRMNGIFKDNNSTLCSSKYLIANNIAFVDNNNNNNDNDAATPYNVTFMDFSNKNMVIVGSIASFMWTLLFIIYHLSLLNYPSIYHTKTAVFTVFLASLANITLSTSLSDPYTFLPNSISVVFSMVHFSSWAYHIKINIDSYSIFEFITFNRNEIKRIIQRDNGNNTKTFHGLSSVISYSNNSNFHLNTDSITNRRKTKIKQNRNISKISSSHPYRGRHSNQIIMTDSKFVKIFFMIFVMISILTHFTVIFITNSLSETDRFNFFSALVLFQWILCLTYLISWYQNYRFEYAIELLLNDGYSLNYLLGNQYNLQINDIKQETETLDDDDIETNDKYFVSSSPNPSNPPNPPKPSNLPNPPKSYKYNYNETNLSSIYNRRKARGSIQLNEFNEPLLNINNNDISSMISSKNSIVTISTNKTYQTLNVKEILICCCNGCCCYFCRKIGILLLNLVKYLPFIVLLNSCIWIYFGLYIVNVEVIWLQHTISSCLSFVYLLFSLCMNEKHIILDQETNVPMITKTIDEINNESDFNYITASLQFKQKQQNHNIHTNDGQIQNFDNFDNFDNFELTRERSQTERDYKINGNNLNTIQFKVQ